MSDSYRDAMRAAQRMARDLADKCEAGEVMVKNPWDALRILAHMLGDLSADVARIVPP